MSYMYSKEEKEMALHCNYSHPRCTKPDFDFVGQTKACLVNHIRQRHGGMVQA